MARPNRVVGGRIEDTFKKCWFSWFWTIFENFSRGDGGTSSKNAHPVAFCTFYTLVCRFRRSRGAKSSKTFEKTDFLIFSCPFENFFCSEDLNTIQTDRNLTKSTLADSISPGVFESHRMERAHPPKKPPRLTIDIRKSPKQTTRQPINRKYGPNADREDCRSLQMTEKSIFEGVFNSFCSHGVTEVKIMVKWTFFLLEGRNERVPVGVRVIFASLVVACAQNCSICSVLPVRGPAALRRASRDHALNVFLPYLLRYVTKKSAFCVRSIRDTTSRVPNWTDTAKILILRAFDWSVSFKEEAWREKLEKSRKVCVFGAPG